MASRIYLILLISICTLVGQINWDIEIVDSTLNPPNEFHYQNALALDKNYVPNIIYNGTDFNTLTLATRVSDNVWTKDIIDSGLFYACPSLVFDSNNKPHCCYYQKVGSTAYLYHTFFDSLIWNKEVIDSMYGVLTNYWFTMAYFNTSMAIDSLDHCGIAYISWDQADSVFFVKYAHNDGSSWNVSTVEYDTAWSPHLQPSDWAVNLEYNLQNEPLIAFHQNYSNNDTIKLAHWVDSLNIWIIEPVITDAYGCASISMVLDDQGYPHIAYGENIGLCHAWWNGAIWQSEYSGFNIGILSTRISLDLDNSNKPHILYQTMGALFYCYKDTVWHDGSHIDSSSGICTGDIAIGTNDINQPNVSYRSDEKAIKYAQGTFISVDEERSDTKLINVLDIYPNPFIGKSQIIIYAVDFSKPVLLEIFDVTGSKVRTIKIRANNSTHSYSINWNGTDEFGRQLPVGIYFIELTTGNSCFHQKVILLRN